MRRVLLFLAKHGGREVTSEEIAEHRRGARLEHGGRDARRFRPTPRQSLRPQASDVGCAAGRDGHTVQDATCGSRCDQGCGRDVTSRLDVRSDPGPSPGVRAWADFVIEFGALARIGPTAERSRAVRRSGGTGGCWLYRPQNARHLLICSGVCRGVCCWGIASYRPRCVAAEAVAVEIAGARQGGSSAKSLGTSM